MKKWVKLLVGASLIGVFTAGCQPSEEAESKLDDALSDEYKPYGKYEEPVKFTIGRSQRDLSYMPEGDTIEDNPASRFLIEETNIVPEVAWETADFNQKLALSLTTGDIPDVMAVNYTMYQELLENDLLEDLTEAYDLAASDNVKERIDSYDQDVLELASDSEGKLRAIPMPFYYYEHTLTWIRKDWLDEVGADIPETIDDLHDVAKQFVDAGLSKEGETYGFTLDDTIGGIIGASDDASPIFNQFNSYPRQWINKDGEITYGSIQPETKEGLALLRDWYAEGLIDPQFAVRTDEERTGLLVDGVGIYFGPWWVAQFSILETIKDDPSAEWIALAAPKNDEGEFMTARANPMLRYIVVRKGYEHPEAIVRALNNVTDFNFSLTEEAIEFREKEFGEDTYFPWYYAPIDYKLENAHANKMDYEALKEAVEENSDENLPQHLKGSYQLIEDYLEDGRENYTAWAEYAIFMEGLKAATDEDSVFEVMAFYQQTPTMETKWTNLLKLENETFLDIIMGEKDLDAFDDFVADWKSQGGDEITQEVIDAVEKE